jgi:hypothetical protein
MQSASLPHIERQLFMLAQTRLPGHEPTFCCCCWPQAPWLVHVRPLTIVLVHWPEMQSFSAQPPY